MMYKLLLIIPFVVFMACNGSDGPLTSGPVDIKYVGRPIFTYDVTAVARPFVAKPFAQKIGDTLIIADYWAIGEGTGHGVDVEIDGNIITLKYVGGMNGVDWMVPVETVLKFTGTFPDSLTVKFKCCAPDARDVEEWEKALGFRNATDSLVKVVYMNSL